MGWTYTYRERGVSHVDWFAQYFGDGRDGGKGVVDAAAAGGFKGEVYIAYRDGAGNIIAVVCMINWVGNDNRFNFGWKDMTEFSGPGAARCPERILDMLTPLPEVTDLGDQGREWAAKWRARCRAKVQAKKARLGLRKGTIVTFNEPIEFMSGIKAQTFEVQNGRRMLVKDRYGHLYRLRRWVLEENGIKNVAKSWPPVKRGD